MPTPTEIEKLQGQLLEMAGRINAACTREDERPTWIHWSDAQVLVAVADKLGHMNNVQSLLTESLGLLGKPAA